MEELNCSDNKIVSLKLNNNKRLKKVLCYNNELKRIEISKNTNLIKLDCKKNYLKDLDFLNKLDPNKLVELNISNNNFPPQNLEAFGKFVNLVDFRIEKNKFNGSLKPLRGLTELKKLIINDNDIERGLEYLSNKAELSYQGNKSIEDELEPYEGNLKHWRVKRNKHQWLDKNYPRDGLCKRKDDEENQGKEREEIVKLDLSNQNLEDSLIKLMLDKDLSDDELGVNVENLKKKNTRNILIIGKKMSGKSALANSLLGKKMGDSDSFGESSGINSRTEKVEYKYSENLNTQKPYIKYRIIDSVGIEDIESVIQKKEELSKKKEEALCKLAEFSCIVKDGLNQIFLVTTDPSEWEWIKPYEVLSSIIFDKDVENYITIVRTNFKDGDGNKFDELSSINSAISKRVSVISESNFMIELSKKRPIIVDNDGKESSEGKISDGRESTRKDLINHLSKFDGIYKPENLNRLSRRIIRAYGIFDEEKDEFRSYDKLLIAKEVEKYIEKREREISSQEVENELFTIDNLKKASEIISPTASIIATIVKITTVLSCSIM